MEALVAAVATVAAIVTIADGCWKVATISSKDLKTVLFKLSSALDRLRDTRELQLYELKEHSVTTLLKEKCTNWLDRVTKNKDEAEKIIEKYKKRKLSIFKQAEWGEKMGCQCSGVIDLCNEGIQLIGDVEKEPNKRFKMNAPDIKEFPTLQGRLEEILSYLTNPEVKGILVWGTVGVGKTAIMRNLNNHEEVAKHFELVIWVDISTWNGKNLTTEQMQQKILERLKLKVDAASDVRDVACKIRQKLMQRKCLLLLDDVQEDFELDQIGIDLDNENGNKVVLTSTNYGVCNSVVDRAITVGELTEKEARRMFKKVVNLSNQRAEREIERIMDQVLKFCGGCLPLVINTVANDFKMRVGVQKWRDGLERLRLWPEQQDNKMTELYKRLNFCSSQLEGVPKYCFIYSAIYPAGCDIPIDCLLECWQAEDFEDLNLDNRKRCMQNYRCILEHLTNISLLEESECKRHVRMQKLIRQATLFSLSTDDKYQHLVRTGKSLEESPGEKEWHGKNWISLADNELETLPESPDCSRLSTLFLQKNSCLRTVPDPFFEHMETLRVLNVECTKIESLPSSVSRLIRLKVLYLNDCADLVVLPSEVGVLKSIEVIYMRNSGVKKIPREIENLSLLRCLLLSFPIGDNSDDDQIVSHNCEVISTISKLEKLVIDVRCDKQRWNEMQNEVIDKISATLTTLTTLKFCYEGSVEDEVIKVVDDTSTFRVPNANAFTGFLHRRDVSKPKSLQIFIGCSTSSRQISYLGLKERYLKSCNGNGCNATIREVLKQTTALELFDNNELEHVSDFGITNLHNVQVCLIEACNEIKAIANNVDSPILRNLEELRVKMMPKLESILKGPVPAGSLCNLKTLKIENCHLIRELFVGSGNLNDDFLQNLETLILIEMPYLAKICSSLLDCPALRKLHIHNCPSFVELPFTEDCVEKLNSIEVEKRWWNRSRWPIEVKQRLEPRCSFR